MAGRGPSGHRRSSHAETRLSVWLCRRSTGCGSCAPLATSPVAQASCDSPVKPPRSTTAHRYKCGRPASSPAADFKHPDLSVSVHRFSLEPHRKATTSISIDLHNVGTYHRPRLWHLPPDQREGSPRILQLLVRDRPPNRAFYVLTTSVVERSPTSPSPRNLVSQMHPSPRR